jgi:hypothetical protein
MSWRPDVGIESPPSSEGSKDPSLHSCDSYRIPGVGSRDPTATESAQRRALYPIESFLAYIISTTTGALLHSFSSW